MKKIFAVLMVLAMVLLLGISAQAACTQALSTQWKGNLFGGLYTSAHTYKIAFYQAAATWDATTTQYASTNEITGTNYSAGGYTLVASTPFADTSGTTAFIDFADYVSSSTTFNQASTCAVIYDSSAANTSCTGSKAPWQCCSGSGAGTCANSVLGVFTFTSVQPSAGTLTVTFPTADASNAVFRIARDVWDYFSLFGIADAADSVDAVVEIKGMEIKSGFGL